MPMQCDDETVVGTVFEKWNRSIVEACQKVGVKLDFIFGVPALLRRKGFVGLGEAETKWALGPWPKDRRQKRIGRMFQDVSYPVLFHPGLRSFPHPCFRISLGILRVSRRACLPRRSVGSGKRFWPICRMLGRRSKAGGCMHICRLILSGRRSQWTRWIEVLLVGWAVMLARIIGIESSPSDIVLRAHCWRRCYGEWVDGRPIVLRCGDLRAFLTSPKGFFVIEGYPRIAIFSLSKPSSQNHVL